MAWSLEEAISYYQSQGAPGQQSALISLLREIQQESGGSIPVWVPTAIADAYSIKEGVLLALIRRIPSLRLGQGHLLELCGGPNCGKNQELVVFAEELQRKSGKFTLNYVSCMRLCGKGPNIRWNGKLYHGATKELLKTLIDNIQ